MTEHLDVIVVGAGVSGIGAAYYLRRDHPERSLAVLEAREASGGTWDLFRYPGIRSDSDLHTFGFEFSPWREEKAIADGPSILRYLRETAAQHDLERLIRYRTKVVAASWSSDDARWTVEVETDGRRVELTCSWLLSGGGYYSYDEGFTPRFEGRERFQGQVVHPQHWPEDLSYEGKRVLVIGSGATAVTLVPAMAATASHVTMLQRTPSYVMPVPSKDAIANALRPLLGDERAYALVRRKNIAQQRLIWRFCTRHPAAARKAIRWVTTKQLGPDFDVDTHFTPPYDPWDQRLCAVPDGDLFRVLRAGTASIVTDRIATFTENGVLLESGRELEADIIVTATGLRLQPFGGFPLTVDGQRVQLRDTVAFKGMMLSGVPNFAYAIGYTNASWTLKIGLLWEHVGRLMTHMDAHGHDTVRPVADPAMETRPFLDFAAGYVKRALDDLPRQGVRAPWLTTMDYRHDVQTLRRGPVEDPELQFSSSRTRVAELAA